MSYTKQTWVDGDLITAEKLNHIEDGVKQASDHPLMVKALSSTDGVENPTHTYEEMLEAYNSGRYIVLKLLMMPEEYGKQAEFLPLASYYDGSNVFTFSLLVLNGNVVKSQKVTCDSSNTWTYTQATK